MNALKKMIVCQYPYAVPDEDFTIKTGENGHPEIGYWNTEKLGTEPSLTAMHANYMRWAKRKKEMLPKFDDSDPAPWLNAVEDRTEISRTIAQEANEEQNLVHLDTYCVFPNGIIAKKKY